MAVFLALDLAWIAREESRFAERTTQRLRGQHQCTRDPVPYGVGLRRAAASVHINQSIVLPLGRRYLEGLEDPHSCGITREVGFQCARVDRHGPSAGEQ